MSILTVANLPTWHKMPGPPACGPIIGAARGENGPSPRWAYPLGPRGALPEGRV
jgi:hypothetical protein